MTRAELERVGAFALATYEGWSVERDAALAIAHRISERALELRWKHEWPGRDVQLVGFRRADGFGARRSDAGFQVLQTTEPEGEGRDHGLAPGSVYFYRFELRRPATARDGLTHYFRPLDLEGPFRYGPGIQFQCALPDADGEAILRAKRDIEKGELSKRRLVLERDLRELVADSPERPFERELRSKELASRYAVRFRAVELEALRQALLERRELLARLEADLTAGDITPEEAQILRDHIDLLGQGDATRA